MSEENIYENRPSSQILFLAVTNNLRLNDWKRHSNETLNEIFCDWILRGFKALFCCGGQDMKRSRIMHRKRRKFY